MSTPNNCTCPNCGYSFTDLNMVRLPLHNSRVSVIFESGASIGTLEFEGELINVYMGNMEAHQLGCIDESCMHLRYKSPGNIKRVFKLIEI